MKYSVTAEFDLGTNISPELNHAFSPEVEDFQDGSYFDSGEVSVSGGQLNFTLTAADEDAAHEAAETVVYDGMEVEDSNGIVWAVENLRFEFEAQEMSKEEALVVVRRLLDRLAENGTLSSEEREAFDVILQDV